VKTCTARTVHAAGRPYDLKGPVAADGVQDEVLAEGYGGCFPRSVTLRGVCPGC
jgi:hypothetical protein